MSNAAWHRRRTKQGMAARQYAACVRKLRRARKAGQPLPITVQSRGVGIVLTVTIDHPEEY